jgi:site-specific DNA-methyltransferase (adenine-specific)
MAKAHARPPREKKKAPPLDPSNRIFSGPCLNHLRLFPDNSIDAVVMDPPYGLGTKEPTLDEILAYLQGADLDTGGDFMSTDWEIPSVLVWRELYRVLKPGGYVLTFGGTRTWDLISLGARAASFEYRDSIPNIFPDLPGFLWLYAQGRAKMSLANTLAKKATKEEQEAWKGLDVGLKPAWEPILMYRKPLEGSILDNLRKWGTGALNIDGTRVFTDWNEPDRSDSWKRSGHTKKPDAKKIAAPPGQGINLHPLGRWPPNVIFVHAPECKEIDAASEKWKCAPGCPVEDLDEGTRRFFPRLPPFQYEGKVSRKEATLDGELKNDHLTKKPVAVMKRLVTLVTPPAGLVLDPYCGSGSTLHAAVEAGFRFCGIEKDPESFKTSVKRIQLVAARQGRIWKQ